MNKEIKKILKEIIGISSFGELDKLVEEDFDCISTYWKRDETIHKIREKRYSDKKIEFEESYKRMEDDYLCFEDKTHSFDYSEPNMIKEIIGEENDSYEDYVIRRFDEKERLIFEQNKSNYDQPGYEKLFFLQR